MCLLHNLQEGRNQFENTKFTRPVKQIWRSTFHCIAGSLFPKPIPKLRSVRPHPFVLNGNGMDAASTFVAYKNGKRASVSTSSRCDVGGSISLCEEGPSTKMRRGAYTQDVMQRSDLGGLQVLQRKQIGYTGSSKRKLRKLSKLLL